MCGTRGSGIVPSAGDVLGMSVVLGMRGVGGLYEMSGWGWCGRRVNKRIWLYQSCGNMGSVGRVSVFGLQWCGCVVGEGFVPGSGRVGWCVPVWVLLWLCMLRGSILFVSPMLLM